MGRRTGGAVGRITAKLDLCDSSVKPDRLALRLYTRTHAKDCNLDASTGEQNEPATGSRAAARVRISTVASWRAGPVLQCVTRAGLARTALQVPGAFKACGQGKTPIEMPAKISSKTCHISRACWQTVVSLQPEPRVCMSAVGFGQIVSRVCIARHRAPRLALQGVAALNSRCLLRCPDTSSSCVAGLSRWAMLPCTYSEVRRVYSSSLHRSRCKSRACVV
jgi:hypothetical protein